MFPSLMSKGYLDGRPFCGIYIVETIEHRPATLARPTTSFHVHDLAQAPCQAAADGIKCIPLYDRGESFTSTLKLSAG